MSPDSPPTRIRSSEHLPAIPHIWIQDPLTIQAFPSPVHQQHTHLSLNPMQGNDKTQERQSPPHSLIHVDANYSAKLRCCMDPSIAVSFPKLLIWPLLNALDSFNKWLISAHWLNSETEYGRELELVTIQRYQNSSIIRRPAQYPFPCLYQTSPSPF